MYCAINVCNVCSIFCRALCLERKHLPFLFIHTYGKFDVLAAAIICMCLSTLTFKLWNVVTSLVRNVHLWCSAHITMKDKTLHVTWLETCLRETKRVYDREQVVSFSYIKISMSECSMCSCFFSAGCWQACSHTVPSSRPSAPNPPSENTWDIKQKSSPQVSVFKIYERYFIDKID